MKKKSEGEHVLAVAVAATAVPHNPMWEMKEGYCHDKGHDDLRLSSFFMCNFITKQLLVQVPTL